VLDSYEAKYPDTAPHIKQLRLELTQASNEEDAVSREDYDYLWEEYAALDEKVADLEWKLAHISDNFEGIVNIDDFKYRLRLDGVLTPEVEESINFYMKYHNKEFLEEMQEC
jgi:hypothetical protein